jgi:hypothetical protein
MKKSIALYIAIIMTVVVSTASADEISEAFNRGKSFYFAQNYYSSVRNGMQAVDGVCKVLTEKLIDAIPTLDNFILFQTNYFYSFGGEQSTIDAYFKVEKMMSNTTEIITIGIDNSLALVQSYQNLIIGFDYLSSSGPYAKTNYTTRYSAYPCIIENNSVAYVPFVYQETNGIIQSGAVLKVSFKFLTGPSSSQKRKKIDQYMYQILVKLKTGTLKYILQ